MHNFQINVNVTQLYHIARYKTHTIGILTFGVVSISFIICRGIPNNSENINS